MLNVVIKLKFVETEIHFPNGTGEGSVEQGGGDCRIINIHFSGSSLK